MDCLSLYQNGADRLSKCGIADAELESALFLAFILDVPRSSVLLNLPDCTKKHSDCFNAYIDRRCQYEPFAYIVGWQEFWSLEFKVTPDVLIPRPETELIIEHLSSVFTDKNVALRILDCGTGSGVLPVTLATIYPQATFTALDVSAKALRVARENSKIHKVSDRIVYIQADFRQLLEFAEPFDVIVSNPPYVNPATFVELQKDVVQFEPHLALDGKGDGFVIVDHLLRTLPEYLKDGGHLFMEIGFDQQQRAEELLRSLPFYGQYKVYKDYAGLPRMIHAVKVKDLPC